MSFIRGRKKYLLPFGIIVFHLYSWPPDLEITLLLHKMHEISVEVVEIFDPIQSAINIQMDICIYDHRNYVHSNKSFYRKDRAKFNHRCKEYCWGTRNLNWISTAIPTQICTYMETFSTWQKFWIQKLCFTMLVIIQSLLFNKLTGN